MKWYKHDSNAHTDAKLKRIMLKYGMEGYGLYWYCLELIAKNVDQHNLTFHLEEDSELIAAATNIHQDRVQEMMTFMCNTGLFDEAEGRISCLKMATRTDEYTTKLLRNPDVVRRVSGECPDKVPPIRIDKKRIDKNKNPSPTPAKADAADKKLKAQQAKAKRVQPYIKTTERMWECIQPLTNDKTAPNIENWADEIRKLVDIDGRSLAEVHEVFGWANKDHFWQAQILSTANLRKQFPALYVKMKSENKNNVYEVSYV